MGIFPNLAALNIMHLTSTTTAILSAVIYNAFIIIALIPLSLRGVKYRELPADKQLRHNLMIYGVGGIILPFIVIKLIDMALTMCGIALSAGHDCLGIAALSRTGQWQPAYGDKEWQNTECGIRPDRTVLDKAGVSDRTTKQRRTDKPQCCFRRAAAGGC